MLKCVQVQVHTNIYGGDALRLRANVGLGPAENFVGSFDFSVGHKTCTKMYNIDYKPKNFFKKEYVNK